MRGFEIRRVFLTFLATDLFSLETLALVAEEFTIRFVAGCCFRFFELAVPVVLLFFFLSVILESPHGASVRSGVI